MSTLTSRFTVISVGWSIFPYIFTIVFLFATKVSNVRVFRIEPWPAALHCQCMFINYLEMCCLFRKENGQVTENNNAKIALLDRILTYTEFESIWGAAAVPCLACRVKRRTNKKVQPSSVELKA